ncbi:MAG: TauD/TfdA family dioxygenase [Alphaproteobacteria bacterium]
MPDGTQHPEIERQPAVPGQPVIDPAVWTGADMAGRDDWIYALTADDLAALKDTASSIRARIGDDPDGLLDVDTSTVDLGAIAAPMSEIVHQLRDGRGFQLIRGMPVAAWDRLDLAIAYWVIGQQIGEPLSNNPEGDMLGHVTDLGKDYENPNHRGYQTSAHMLFHTDQCDVVSLLCLQTAKSGGQSKIVSAPAVHNEMIARRPDLVEELTADMYWTKHGETAPGEDPWYRMAVVNYFEGYLTIAGGYKHIEKGHAILGNPPLTAAQKEAFALLAELNEELHLSMSFEIGDIQILNSHVTMHSRTSYEDWPDPDKKRRLWRLWLKNSDLRPRPEAFNHRTQGIIAPDTRPRIVL